MYAAALREYVARHAPDEVTDALNHVVAAISGPTNEDAFSGETARRLLQRTEW